MVAQPRLRRRPLEDVMLTIPIEELAYIISKAREYDVGYRA